jgi:hypothetical protein
MKNLRNIKISNFLLKQFSDKLRKEEILFYIMNDKHSIKPDKEYRINHTTLDTHNQKTNKIVPTKIMSYGKLKINK